MRQVPALLLCALLTIGCGSGESTAGSVASASETRDRGRFDSAAAFELLVDQVERGPRPAGSPQSRALAEDLRRELPRGRFQRVPGGLRNVVGIVEGRNPKRRVALGAHYDTKDIPGFVGANDGASGTAIVTQLARTIDRHELEPTVVFMLFDGEEAPRGVPDSQFYAAGLRGSRVAARKYRDLESMILLDFVGDRDLAIPRETNSDPGLWRQLRRAAERAGHGEVFPPGPGPTVTDDHTPFLERGVPAIDLIDFEFDCFHRVCDDLGAVSRESVEAVGESVYRLLRSL